jgi:hypothetical protein
MNDVVDYARNRGIKEILHFTTNRGLIGVLAQNKIYSRDSLNEDDYLENIKVLNSPSRTRDAAWTGYVNLSITIVNLRMLGSSRKWHPEEDIWWAVLAFDPEILGHDGVQFTTTNNVYPPVKRGPGVSGLDALFAQRIPWGIYGDVIRRPSDMAIDLTTDSQAEVLYPDAVDLSHLRAIYVEQPEHIDEVAGWLAAFQYTSKVDLSSVAVTCKPEVFGG